MTATSINRFIEPIKEYYKTIITELRQEKKVNHWIWFAFPQLRGLGKSYNSYYFGLSGVQEAKDFISNKFLRKSLLNFVNLLINSKSNSLVDIMGEIDAKKVQSSMTIFYIATEYKMFKKVLDKFFYGELDKNTLFLIN